MTQAMKELDMTTDLKTAKAEPQFELGLNPCLKDFPENTRFCVRFLGFKRRKSCLVQIIIVSNVDVVNTVLKTCYLCVVALTSFRAIRAP